MATLEQIKELRDQTQKNSENALAGREGDELCGNTAQLRCLPPPGQSRCLVGSGMNTFNK